MEFKDFKVEDRVEVIKDSGVLNAGDKGTVIGLDTLEKFLLVRFDTNQEANNCIRRGWFPWRFRPLSSTPEPTNVNFICCSSGPIIGANGVDLPFKVNRRTGVVTIGCRTMSVQTIRNVLARVESALKPTNDEVDV